MSRQDFDTLLARLRERLDNMVPRFIQTRTTSRSMRALGRIGMRFERGRV
jgi:hypothetical protein